MDTVARPVKDTPLTQKHIALGARIAPFAGYRMPIQYTGIIPEHRAVRTKVGLFDLSHMGEIEVGGIGMLEFLERVTTNDVSSLATYQAQYTLLLNENGGIIDDLVLYHLANRALLVVNAANIEKDFAWLKAHCPPSVRVIDKSDETALVAVQGPKAAAVVQKFMNHDVSQIGYYHAAEGTVDGKQIIMSRTGYTGEDGFELYMPNELAADCWEAALDAGGEFGIVPIGLGARDTLRMEMKYALYGNDIDEATNPLEAGLGWVVKPDKPHDFIGKDHIVAMKNAGPQRRLVAFAMDDRAIPRSSCEIRVNGTTVGRVTSGTHSPSLDIGIGLGYVATPHASPDSKIEIVIRDKTATATIIKPPFVKNTSHL